MTMTASEPITTVAFFIGTPLTMFVEQRGELRRVPDRREIVVVSGVFSLVSERERLFERPERRRAIAGQPRHDRLLVLDIRIARCEGDRLRRVRRRLRVETELGLEPGG